MLLTKKAPPSEEILASQMSRTESGSDILIPPVYSLLQSKAEHSFDVSSGFRKGPPRLDKLTDTAMFQVRGKMRNYA